MTDRFDLAGLRSEMKQRKPLFDPMEPKVELGAICSFCHKQEHEVEFMLLAAVSAVCSECIILHERILCEYRSQQEKE
jgi:hypothetical protein